jgi:predicted transposase YdaD
MGASWSKGLLFEHQSSPDAAMPFRLLRYVVRIWERWRRDHPATTTLPFVPRSSVHGHFVCPRARA